MLYKGRPLEEYTKEELIKMIVLMDKLDQQRINGMQEIIEVLK